MNEQISPTGHEPVDSALPIDTLKSRIIEMAKHGKKLVESTQTQWRQVDVQSGFEVRLKAIFIPEAFVLNEEDELPNIDQSENVKGMTVLVRNLFNVDDNGEIENKPFFGYLINIPEGEDAFVLLDRKSFSSLKAAQTVGFKISEADDLLATMAEDKKFRFDDNYKLVLSNKSAESMAFVGKLAESLASNKIDLIEDVILPESEISEPNSGQHVSQ